MKIRIIGNVPEDVTAQDFVRFLKFKGCPAQYCSKEFVGYYASIGKIYGVRWDLAICQSILETGCFNFEGSSVTKAHYNYAGIGATDSNPEPEQYLSMSRGVRAHIQVLAIRGGIDIGPDNMGSKRYKKYYHLVFDKQHYWSQLAGTWASDSDYWTKIQKIAHEFEVLTGTKILVETSHESVPSPVKNIYDAVNWFKLFPMGDGFQTAVGYHDHKPIIEQIGNSIEPLINLFEDCKNAMTFVIANSDEPKPKIEQYQESEQETKKLKIMLDPGHSKSDPGAVSPNRKVREYVLNLAQAQRIKELLDDEYQVDIYDPNPDNLIDVGEHAKGYDIFVSLHHNSYSGTGEPGVECFVHSSLSRASNKRVFDLADSICSKIASVLSIPNRGQKSANFSVIKHASKHCDAVLVESHFVSDEIDLQSALDKSIEAAEQIADAIVEHFDSDDAVQEQEQEYKFWRGVREFKKHSNVQLSENFTSNEFDCNCSRGDCVSTKIDGLQLERLQRLRNLTGQPVHTHSAYRCPIHNASVGGAPNSQHVAGRATDIHCDHPNWQQVAKNLWKNGGIGTYAWGLHVDTWSKRRW